MPHTESCRVQLPRPKKLRGGKALHIASSGQSDTLAWTDKIAAVKRTLAPLARLSGASSICYDPLTTSLIWSGKMQPARGISNLRRDAVRKLARQLILASKRFWPKWLRNGKGSLRRRRAKEENGTFEVPRKTLATRACLLETGSIGQAGSAKAICVAWGCSSHHVTLMCGRVIQRSAPIHGTASWRTG